MYDGPHFQCQNKHILVKDNYWLGNEYSGLSGRVSKTKQSGIMWVESHAEVNLIPFVFFSFW